MRHFCNYGLEDLTIKVLNAMLNLVIWIVVLVASLVCIYVVYDGLRVTRSAVLSDEILVYAPRDEDVDLTALREINEDIVGWLRLDGTSIDYPIVQGTDNDYYLVRNYLREFATAGSIFLDYRSSFDDDFLIIYGHRMSYGGMFTDIIKYKERQFFDEHSTGVLFLDEVKYRLEVVAFGLIASENKVVYGLKESAVREIMTHAMYTRDASEGKYMLLSTCDASNKTMRDVLLVRIVE